MTQEHRASVVVSDLGVDTRVELHGEKPHTYRATISNAWNVLYAFGGMTATLALRAAEAAVNRRDMVPLSATAMFCSPVPCGPVEIETEIVRSGKSVTNCQTTLRGTGSGEVGVRMIASFGELLESDLHFVQVEFPSDVGPPDEYETLTIPPDWPGATVPVHAHHEWRPAVGHAPWDRDWSPGRARVAAWTRYRKPAKLSDGSIDPVTYFLPADFLMVAVNQALGPGRDSMLVSLELSIQVFATTSCAWMLQHCYAHHVGSGYAFGQVELWDEDRKLLAIASQRARALGAGR